jgi:hypothetical protein
MPKRSSRKKGTSAPAAVPSEPEAEQPPVIEGEGAASAPDGKNPAAVALGKLGGKKGGPARAAKLSKKERSEIARKAAQAKYLPPNAVVGHS